MEEFSTLLISSQGIIVEEEFPLPFMVFLAGLRIKETWDQLAGESKM